MVCRFVKCSRGHECVKKKFVLETLLEDDISPHQMRLKIRCQSHICLCRVIVYELEIALIEDMLLRWKSGTWGIWSLINGRSRCRRIAYRWLHRNCRWCTRWFSLLIWWSVPIRWCVVVQILGLFHKRAWHLSSGASLTLRRGFIALKRQFNQDDVCYVSPLHVLSCIVDIHDAIWYATVGMAYYCEISPVRWWIIISLFQPFGRCWNYWSRNDDRIELAGQGVRGFRRQCRCSAQKIRCKMVHENPWRRKTASNPFCQNDCQDTLIVP